MFGAPPRIHSFSLSGRNVGLLGDDALVRLFAPKSTPPRLYVITGPLSRLWNPEKVGGPKSIGLIEGAWLGNSPTIKVKTLAGEITGSGLGPFLSVFLCLSE